MTELNKLKVIPTAEVKKHRDKENGVWMIIHNNVYDVTSFLEEHPGGEDSLLDVAGQEATQDFEDVGHSDDARELMKKYLIGTLPCDEKITPSGPSTPDDKCKLEPLISASRSRCSLCSQSSCPHLPRTDKSEKTWRTYDGSSNSRRVKSENGALSLPKHTPRPENRVRAIHVPVERFSSTRTPSSRSTAAAKSFSSLAQPRGPSRKSSFGSPSSSRRPRGRPCESGSNLKWAVLALAGAVVLGIVLKKYLSK